MTPLGTIALLIAVLVIGGALAWYLLITTEGVYLGRRVVVWLYDIYARRYDNIKNFDLDWEAVMLARPILAALTQVESPLILDVATGTARLPLLLLREYDFNGHVIGLDFSLRMLKVAAQKIAETSAEENIDPLRVELMYQHAQHLPFPDDTFDAVACLEALEFMPNPNAVLAELVRVLRPGGLLLTTNRKGAIAKMMPGKTQPGKALKARLESMFGLEDVAVAIWQVDYEQVWAYKPGELEPALEGANYDLADLLRCPRCGGTDLIRAEDQTLRCLDCDCTIPADEDGIILYARA